MIFRFQLQLTGKSRQKWRKFSVQIYIEGKTVKIAASAVNSSSSPTGLSYFFPRKMAKVMLSCSSLYLLMIHSHCLETAHSKFWNLIGLNKKYNKTSLYWRLHRFPIIWKLHKPTRDGFIFEEHTFPHPDYTSLLDFFLPLENSQSVLVIVVYSRTSGDPCVYRSGIKEAKPGR